MYFSHHLNMNIFYNSDELFLPSLFRDMSHGAFSFSSWNFSAATFIFPDWPFFMISSAVGGSVYRAFSINFSLQILSVWLLTYLIIRRSGQPRIPALLSTSLTFLIMIVWVQNDIYPFSIALLSVSHFGSFLSWMLATLFLLIFLDVNHSRKKDYYIIFWLCVLIMLTTLADKLFVLHWVVPSLVAMPILWKKFQFEGKRIGLLFMLISLSTIVGFVAYWMLPHAFGVGVALAYFGENCRVLWMIFYKFLEQHTVITSIILLSDIGWSWILVKGLLKKGPDEDNISAFLLSVMMVGGLTESLFPLAFSTYRLVDEAESRYLLPFFFAPILLAPVLLDKLYPNLRSWLTDKKWISGVILAAGCGILVKNAIMPAFKAGPLYTDYYPESARCLDKASYAWNTRRGIALYWQARKMTFLSKDDLNIVQVTPDLRPYLWIANKRWFEGDFDFAVIGNADPEGVALVQNLEKRMGLPVATRICKNLTIYYYGKDRIHLQKTN